jgi:thiosulfate dehydrogenase [quinone] large subunit
MSSDRNARGLAGLRIGVGVLFLIFAEYKIFGAEFTRGGGFRFWINRFLAEGSYPFMAPILKDVVLPHAKFCAFLVAYGELAIALALVFGVLVRTASVFGLAYMMALLFSSNYPGAHAAFWQYFGASLDHSVLLLCFATFAFANADQAFALLPAKAAWGKSVLPVPKLLSS